jgi:hypothetical protein
MRGAIPCINYPSLLKYERFIRLENLAYRRTNERAPVEVIHMVARNFEFIICPQPLAFGWKNLEEP